MNGLSENTSEQSRGRMSKAGTVPPRPSRTTSPAHSRRGGVALSCHVGTTCPWLSPWTKVGLPGPTPELS